MSGEIEVHFDEELFRELKEHVKTEETIRKLGEILQKQDNQDMLINLPRVKMVQGVYEIVKDIFAGTGAKVTCELHKPYKSMGSISIEAPQIMFEEPRVFKKLTELASNTEVYPLTKNAIRMTFTFHGLTKPLK